MEFDLQLRISRPPRASSGWEAGVINYLCFRAWVAGLGRLRPKHPSPEGWTAGGPNTRGQAWVLGCGHVLTANSISYLGQAISSGNISYEVVILGFCWIKNKAKAKLKESFVPHTIPLNIIHGLFWLITITKKDSSRTWTWFWKMKLHLTPRTWVWAISSFTKTPWKATAIQGLC